MAKTGRPKMQPHERRNARLPAIRLTDAERTDLELKAQAAGVDLSEWVRGQLTSAPVKRPPSPTDASLITELNRIGVNLNQIARALNRGRADDPHQLGYILSRLNGVLETMARRYGA